MSVRGHSSDTMLHMLRPEGPQGKGPLWTMQTTCHLCRQWRNQGREHCRKGWWSSRWRFPRGDSSRNDAGSDSQGQGRRIIYHNGEVTSFLATIDNLFSLLDNRCLFFTFPAIKMFLARMTFLECYSKWVGWLSAFYLLEIKRPRRNSWPALVQLRQKYFFIVVRWIKKHKVFSCNSL